MRSLRAVRDFAFAGRAGKATVASVVAALVELESEPSYRESEPEFGFLYDDLIDSADDLKYDSEDFANLNEALRGVQAGSFAFDYQAVVNADRKLHHRAG